MVTRAKKRRQDKRVSGRKRAKERESMSGGTTLNVSSETSFFSLTNTNDRRIDILPYRVKEGNPFAKAGDLHFERTFYAHRGIGAEQNTYVCPSRTAKKPCPICEHVSELQRDPDSDVELIKSLLPKERQLWNVIDLAQPDKGIQIWDISFHLFGKRLDLEINKSDEDEDYEFFADLKDGQTLKLGVVGESFLGRSFYKVETVGFKSRRKPYDESILDDVYNLDEILAVLDYDKLKAIFLQTESEDDVDKKESKPEKTRSKERKQKPKEKTAKEAGLKKGMSVKHEDFGICDVNKISPDGTSLTLEDEDNDIHKAVGVDEVVINEEDELNDVPFDEDESENVDGKDEDDDDENWDDDFGDEDGDD